jgi:hypothetical protein
VIALLVHTRSSRTNILRKRLKMRSIREPDQIRKDQIAPYAGKIAETMLSFLFHIEGDWQKGPGLRASNFTAVVLFIM